MEIYFYTTFWSQIELLPRLTILYGNEPDDEELTLEEDERFGIAFEWLWFGVGIFKEKA